MTETAIDWQNCIKLADNNIEAAEKMLDAYIKALPELREIIIADSKKQNFQDLFLWVHKLHGASYFCGVPQIKASAKNLELFLNKNRKILNKNQSIIDKNLNDKTFRICLEAVLLRDHFG